MTGKLEPPPKTKPSIDAKKLWKDHLVNTTFKAQVVVQRLEEAVASKKAADQESAHLKPGIPSRRQVQPPKQLDVSVQAEALQLQADTHQVLKLIQHALVQRLNAYGVILTVLASVTFVAILQPPGSFDPNTGYLRSPILVGCFVFFSTLSFIFSCTALFAVVVGVTSLFRPAFFLKFEATLERSSSCKASNLDSDSSSHGKATHHLKSSPSELLGIEDTMEDLRVLALLLWDNLNRVWRLRVYLMVSLGSCVCAFGCGAFAVVGPEHRNIYLLVGAIGGGLLVLAFEVHRTVKGINTYHSPKWLNILHEVNPEVAAGDSPGKRLMVWIEGMLHSPKHHHDDGGSIAAPLARPPSRFRPGESQVSP